MIFSLGGQGKHVLLYEDIDGTFPNHHPDPTVDTNLIDLQEAVSENNKVLEILKAVCFFIILVFLVTAFVLLSR